LTSVGKGLRSQNARNLTGRLVLRELLEQG